MKKHIIYIFLALNSLYSCTHPSQEKEEKYNWIYLEVATENQLEPDDYMYGKIKSRILKRIQSDRGDRHAFTIRDIRYISSSDSIEVEEDNVLTGTKTYYSKHIRLIENMKGDPLLIPMDNPLSQKSLQYIKDNKLK